MDEFPELRKTVLDELAARLRRFGGEKA
jgi:hypothetical protein